MEQLKVGSIVTMKIPCWFGWDGMRGVVYEEYDRTEENDTRGVSIIFENGFYDGFSEKEQDQMLLKIGFSETMADYEFVGVNRLVSDFDLLKETIFNAIS